MLRNLKFKTNTPKFVWKRGQIGSPIQERVSKNRVHLFQNFGGASQVKNVSFGPIKVEFSQKPKGLSVFEAKIRAKFVAKLVSFQGAFRLLRSHSPKLYTLADKLCNKFPKTR